MNVGRVVARVGLVCAVGAPATARAQSGEVFYDGPPEERRAPLPVTPTVPVYEPPPPPFGARGEWVVSGSSSLGGSWQKFDNSGAQYGSVDLAPTVDWFVARDVSLGLGTAISFSDNRGYGADGSLVDTKSTVVRLGPRVGYVVHLGRRLTLWPQATLGFEWDQSAQSVVSGASASTGGNALGYPTSTAFGPWVGLGIPLLLHPFPHVFMGVIGSLFHDFANVQGGPEVGGQQTGVNAGFLLGGWFGGPPSAGAAAPEGTTRLPRFGDAGQLAVTNELVLQGGWTGYSGSASRSGDGALALGLDCFAADHFSVGFFAGGGLSSSRSVDATSGDRITSTGSGWNIGGRLGVDVPLGHYASLWPRLSLTYGRQSVQEKDVAAGTQLGNDTTATTVSLYAPVLVHLATHVFVGLGPSVARNLSLGVVATNGTSSGPSVQNPSTTVGAGATVGAWY